MAWYIIRHAQKEIGDFHNPRLRHQDQPLSQQGLRDAEKLVDYFSGKTLGAIYVSGYQRTRQTVARLAERRHIVPIIDERLNEIDNGRVDTMTEAEFQKEFPAEWNAYMERKGDFRFPGGETLTEAQSRVVAFLEEKRRQHRDGNILLVSHDGLIRLLTCHVVGLPVHRRADFQVDLCGLMEFDYQKEYNRWKLIRFNQRCV